MNIERLRKQVEEANTVKEMMNLAGLDPQAALAKLEAVSENQYDYGFSVRTSALANLWRGVPEEYKTAEFANTIIRAANRHTRAKWWIEQERKFSVDQPGTYGELDNDIEEEMNK